MEKVLRPERFDVSPASLNAAKLWRHWFVIFENFPETIEGKNLNKLGVLTNYFFADVYELICEAADYDAMLP